MNTSIAPVQLTTRTGYAVRTPRPRAVFVLRHGSRFVVGSEAAPEWAELGAERFTADFRRLLQFPTRTAALAYLDTAPSLAGAWVCETAAGLWNNTQAAAACYV